MLQADAVEFNFPPPPTFGEFVRAVSFWWLIGLSLIAVGTHFVYEKRDSWYSLLAFAAFVIGTLLCELLGLAFTPLNSHHFYAWSSNMAVNFWADLCLGLTICGSAAIVFWTVRTRWKKNHDS